MVNAGGFVIRTQSRTRPLSVAYCPRIAVNLYADLSPLVNESIAHTACTSASGHHPLWRHNSFVSRQYAATAARVRSSSSATIERLIVVSFVLIKAPRAFDVSGERLLPTHRRVRRQYAGQCIES